jgi:hypothetical protein
MMRIVLLSLWLCGSVTFLFPYHGDGFRGEAEAEEGG